MSISLRANADGSGTLLNGSTPVMEVSAAGVVSLPNIAAGSSANQPVNFGQVLGVGQTWQNVRDSRALGVTYTNSTGKPIVVMARAFTIATGDLVLYVSGIMVDVFSLAVDELNNEYGTVSGIVPSGATYVVTGTTNPWYLEQWSELR